jgi:hypothetical protein
MRDGNVEEIEMMRGDGDGEGRRRRYLKEDGDIQ